MASLEIVAGLSFVAAPDVGKGFALLAALDASRFW